jgi:predicted nucleotide-binding protein (sugar kinase/HSP70/actin superfamily)
MRVLREFDLFQKRERWLRRDGALPHKQRRARARKLPVVGIPRALTRHSHLPLWRRLFEELGARVVVTREADRSLCERGASLVSAEFCFPVKVAHGHVAEAVENEDMDFVFVPYLVAQPAAGEQTNTYLCPYVQGFPSVVTHALDPGGDAASRLLRPIIDRRLAFPRQVKALHAILGPALGVSAAKVRKAYAEACRVQSRFEARCQEAGRASLKALAEDLASGRNPKPGIVILGRPYNVNDSTLNLDLPRKLAEMGYRVFPLDFLPFEPERIPERYRNVYWASGQRILSAVDFVSGRDDLYAIYLTNFNCGPDSFLLSYAMEMMGDKPFLSLEVDEHGADAGYITRIEAFLDVVRAHRPRTRPEAAALPHSPTGELRGRRLWVPPLHSVGSELFAAVFRGDGYDAQALPLETSPDLELGQSVTRGCECLPMRTTIGAFLRAAPQSGAQSHALFMPTTRGPCRFGQYATLDRQILDRQGYADTVILSPSADNAYAGLSEALRRRLWEAILTSDLLSKMALRVRPYELTPGETEGCLAQWIRAAVEAFERKRDLRKVIAGAAQEFAAIPVSDERRPLVGIVGEIYVRNNAFTNGRLIEAIEAAGGEAWMTPVAEWILYTAVEDVRKFVDLPKTPRETLAHGRRILKSRFLQAQDAAFFRAAGPLLADRHEPRVRETLRAAQQYLPFNVAGEAILTIGRTVHFARQGAALVVNASPFSCMAGTVSSALFTRVEEDLGIPVLNLFYEGNGDENRQLDVFLANLPETAPRSEAARAEGQRQRRGWRATGLRAFRGQA